jgi:hypothetical protein
MICDRIKKLIDTLDEETAYDLCDCLSESEDIGEILNFLFDKFPIYKNPDGN